MIAVVAVAVAGLSAWGISAMIWMPGESRRAPLPQPTEHEAALVTSLTKDIHALATGIGERNSARYEALLAAADYIDESFEAAGYPVERQRYEIDGKAFDNLEVERKGTTRPNEIVLIGAHYDSVPGSPGANDNGSGVAAVLALARAFAAKNPARTLRFVAFVNEERPFAQTPRMGSVIYAKRSRERGEWIDAMVSLETMGYFSDRPGSQHYPSVLSWVYPSQGDFIAFVGNWTSRRLLYRAIAAFRREATVPSEGGALPEGLPGVGWSDHWAFWQEGYPAIMLTDTAPFRYPAYHTPQDTSDQIDYGRLARVVAGLEVVIADLAK